MAPITKTGFLFLLCTSALSIQSQLLQAQTSGQHASAVEGKSPVASGDYLVGPSDILEIAVFGVPDLSRSLRVSSSGRIRLPFLDEIEVGGITPAAIERKIASLLEARELVKDPEVSVVVKEPRSRMFSIMGAVRSPGQYQMMEPITLMIALLGAGGLDLSRAGDRLIIQRNSPSRPATPSSVVKASEENEGRSTSSMIIEVDLKQLWEQGDRSLDVAIQPGDLIQVHERIEQAFYIIGDVHSPGRFAYPAKEGIKLSLAIAMAGGPSRTAKLKDAVLLRQLPDGSRQEISINLSKVLKAEVRDMNLLPNDLIFVPGSTVKSIGFGLLGIIPGVATQGAMSTVR